MLGERVFWAGSTLGEGIEALGRCSRNWGVGQKCWEGAAGLDRAVCPTVLCRIWKHPLWQLAVR